MTSFGDSLDFFSSRMCGASWSVRVRVLAGNTVLCSWARHFTLTVPLATQVIVTTNYSRTCIKRSPSIKRSVVKVPKITSLIIEILTCIKRSPLLSGRGQP